MPRATIVCTISLSAELVAPAERLEQEEHRTRSELMREALRHYALTRPQQGNLNLLDQPAA